ncbi:hypothetical protein ACFVVM_20140 [Nocardia sp. NPDC058176]|uniref:hypothetical protein n=1 Tax=Nocardia sp. NPDC058176 TaxID=3346368 RepID=UPI0036D7701E
MTTTIVVILLVWVVLSIPVSFVAARMLRSGIGSEHARPARRTDESHTGRSFH